MTATRRHAPYPDPSAGTTRLRLADGREWELVVDPGSVTAVAPAGPVAESHVSEHDEQVVVEFWADGPDLPGDLGAELVRRTFSLPACRPHRPVLVCVPRRDGAVLPHVLRHVRDSRTRAAGVTCLIEGRVGPEPGSSGRTSAPGSAALRR